MNKNLILLHGKARSGKGEVAKRLCEKFGYTELGFADYLKELSVDVFGWTPDEIWRNRTPESRRFMQLLGNEIGRAKDPDFWIKHLDKKIEGKYKDKKIVISDLRYKNEAQWGLSKSGELWLIRRPDATIEANPEHISEHDLEDWKIWHHIIENDSTLDVLYEKVDDIVLGRLKKQLTKKETDNKASLICDIVNILSEESISIAGNIINTLSKKLTELGWMKIIHPRRKWGKR
jgi:hypothetical protein